MAKIFTDLVREKIKSLLTFEYAALYNYIDTAAKNHFVNVKFDEDKRLYTEEVMVALLYALHRINLIKEVTTLHPHHFTAVDYHIYRGLSKIQEKQNQDKPLTIHQYVVFCFAILREYYKNADGEFAMQLDYFKISSLKLSRLHKLLPIPDDVFDQMILIVNNSSTNNQILNIIDTIEQYILEENIYTKLTNQQKENVTLTWEDMLENVKYSSKDDIDILNTFLTNLMTQTIQDTEKYFKFSKELAKLVNDIKNPIEKPSIQVGQLIVDENHGTLFGDFSQPASLPPDFEMPF